MNPLTIDKLKTLQVGDWVWIVQGEKGCYAEILHIDQNGLNVQRGKFSYWMNYFDYSKTWLAYKNKEQAETKGEIVELPRIEPFSTCNIETGEPCTCYNILYRDKASGELIIDCEVDESEAKALLEELRGEK